jgi:TonB family protein
VAPPPETPQPPIAPPQAPVRPRETWPPLRPPVAAPAFPPPMNFTLGPPAEAPGAPTPGKPLLSLGLPKRGPEDSTPFSMDTDAEVGPDWRNALSQWVGEHSYYPMQAAELGQQGSVRVLVSTMPDGRVIAVDMEKRSGSPWLDLALEALFRGAKLPPLPKSAGDGPVSFHFTMYYYLIR